MMIPQGDWTMSWYRCYLSSVLLFVLIASLDSRAGELTAGASASRFDSSGVAKSSSLRSRSFDFTYEATVADLPAGKIARVWLPVPPSNEDQEAKILTEEIPLGGHIAREPVYNNHILYIEVKGKGAAMPIALTYRVTRREVKTDPNKQPDDMEKPARFLQPDARVPINGKPLELIKDKQVPTDQVAAAKFFYNVVNGHMRYSKEGTGWGRGDSVWACQSGYGNCSDFHSLFISLARSSSIPAKFEIGFPLPEKHGKGEIPGYHCWAKFRPSGKDWIPVDISEANKNPKLKDYYFGNLTENRVAFSIGRDIDLVPKQDGEPLNFFVYPYVEVDGKPYPGEKIHKKFSFKDVEIKGQ
jgi:transglutaminase-like putative cysteine protease